MATFVEEELTRPPRGPSAVVAPPAMALSVLHVALVALSRRALVWAAVLAGAAAWAWAVMHPDPLRIVAATGYCVTVLVPVLIRDARTTGGGGA